MDTSANSPSQATAKPPPPQPSLFSDPYPRLSLNAPSRITLGTLASAVVGLGLGATQGGQMAQLRFRAEHAHKMPDSTTGWYLYHKSKNYHVMYGGMREGFKMASKTAAWTLMALSLETTVDRCRGRSDLFSTIIASLSVAGAFSIWSKFLFSLCCLFYCLETKTWCRPINGDYAPGGLAFIVMKSVIMSTFHHTFCLFISPNRDFGVKAGVLSKARPVLVLLRGESHWLTETLPSRRPLLLQHSCADSQVRHLVWTIIRRHAGHAGGSSRQATGLCRLCATWLQITTTSCL